MDSEGPGGPNRLLRGTSAVLPQVGGHYPASTSNPYIPDPDGCVRHPTSRCKSWGAVWAPQGGLYQRPKVNTMSNWHSSSHLFWPTCHLHSRMPCDLLFCANKQWTPVDLFNPALTYGILCHAHVSEIMNSIVSKWKETMASHFFSITKYTLKHYIRSWCTALNCWFQTWFRGFG